MLIIKVLKNFVLKHKILICTVIFLLAYEFIIVNKCHLFIASADSYVYHIVDYSFGFCSRFLPGAVYGWLVGIYSIKAVSIYLNILYAVYLLMLSALVEKIATRISKKYSSELLIILSLLLVGAFSVSIYFNQFGMLDFHVSFVLVVALLIADKRYLKYFIPFLSVVMVMVQYSALISHLSILFMVLLYFVVNHSQVKVRKEYTIILVVSVLLSLAATIYFILYDRQNLVYTAEQFDSILKSRNSQENYYYVYALYRTISEENQEMIPSLAAVMENSQSDSFLGNIIFQVKLIFALYSWRGLLQVIPLFLVLSVFIYIVMLKYVRLSEEKAHKFFGIVVMGAYPFIVAAGLLFSNDFVRWLAHAIIFGLSMILTIAVNEKESIFEIVKKLLSGIKYYAFAIIGIYALVNPDPFG